MRRAPLVIALGFAGILAFAVAPASAQDRRGGDSRSGGVAQAAPAPRVDVSVRGGGVSRDVDASPRYYVGARYYGGRYYFGSWYYAPVRFFSPYYTFRSRFSVGFGLFIGYPIPYNSPYYYPDDFYPYAYPYPYSYAYPYSYPYARTYPAPGPTYQAPAGLDSQYPPQARNSVGARPGPTYQAPAGLDSQYPNMGGLSFEITPSDARVIVDGHDVGSVGQFTSTSQPLGLPVGRHHIEIAADGYRTMSSDVDVLAGQVIPFQGQMER